jgi:hypothetical protein
MPPLVDQLGRGEEGSSRFSSSLGCTTTARVLRWPEQRRTDSSAGKGLGQRLTFGRIADTNAAAEES